MRRRSAALLAALLAAAPVSRAWGDEAEAEARARFGRGVELVERRAWAEALEAFQASRRLHPTWKATKNAAACLTELGRDDEALDLLEALLRDFPDLPAPAREEVTAAAADLGRRVGAIAVEGGEPGASVIVDGRPRGELPGASAIVDGRPRGELPAASIRVLAGAHAVRLTKLGFQPVEARVVVEPGKAARVGGRMARDELAAVWRRSPRFTMELDAAAFVAPSFGGDVSRSCTGSCIARPAVGARAFARVGLEWRTGFAFGVGAGGLAANQSTTARPGTIQPIGLPPTPGEIHDTRKLRAFVGGAWGAFTIGERRLLRLRLGAGAVLGALGDSRTGRFVPPGGESYTVGPAGDAPRASFAYVEPEVRVGIRLTRGLELSAAVGALVLFDLARPAWDAGHAINAASDGTAFFRAESLVSPVIVAFTPALGLRYEL